MGSTSDRLALLVHLGRPVSGIELDEAQDFVGEVLPQVEDDLFLDLRDRQAGDVDVAVEAQGDLAVGPDQPLARDRPARQRLEDLDEHQVGRLDDVIRHRDLLELAGDVAVGDLLFRRPDRLAAACGANGQ